MYRKVVEAVSAITGILAGVLWVFLLMYFILSGVTPMFGRLVTVAVILSSLSAYLLFREK